MKIFNYNKNNQWLVLYYNLRFKNIYQFLHKNRAKKKPLDLSETNSLTIRKFFKESKK